MSVTTSSLLGRTLTVRVTKQGDEFIARCEQLPAWRYGPKPDIDKAALRTSLLTHQSKHTTICLFGWDEQIA